MSKGIKAEIMLLYDRIGGRRARKDVTALCKERGVEEYVPGSCKPGHEKAYLAICKEVYARWHTTTKFKVGDKVYVKPDESSIFPNWIRATVTETGDPKWGYHLRAFRQDLPGIYMFNIWDKDLLLRTSKAVK